MFKSGFVNIIGRPNVGKSTLMNALVGDHVSIATFKPQTTRHRILGIINGPDHQIVFSDTPGYVHEPNYRMHEKMNRFVMTAFEDADIMMLVTDMDDQYTEDHNLIQKLNDLECPVFLLINKVDMLTEEASLQLVRKWQNLLSFTECIPISALQGTNVDKLLELIIKYLPKGPVYFPEEQLSDRSERFFVSEMIREQIFLQYREEIPYSCEVTVNSFKDEPALVKIEAYIFVNRKTQKSILIGKGGQAIKSLGIASRTKIESFFKKKVFLQLRVKVRENWRNNEDLLNKLGYKG